MRIDAHQHFWNYHPEKHGWINEEMAILKRDFLPADLGPVLTQNSMDGSIAVQAEQSEAETHFLLELAETNDFIRGVVGWVDLRAADIDERLARFAAFPQLCGFRHVVQNEPDVNFMLQESFQNGLRCLGRHGFTYDILIYPTQLETALQTVKRFPDQKFVIDHLAKPYIKKGQLDYWEMQMKALAELENVYCKISGLVTEADWKNWKYTDFVPFLDVATAAFGSHRLLFGSDWPVCLLAGSYQNVRGIVEWYTQKWSKEEQAAIFGQNAIAFYSLA